MATKMQLAKLEFVEEGTPGSQKVAVMDEPGKLSIRYSKIPEPGPYELRVKIKWVGVCGSDLETFRGTRQAEFVSFPAQLGHEVAGVIDKIGANVVGLKTGQTVTCRYVWGAFAEYIVCNPFNVKTLPDDFPLLETSLIEVLPGIIHTAELGKIDGHQEPPHHGAGSQRPCTDTGAVAVQPEKSRGDRPARPQPRTRETLRCDTHL